MRLHIFNPHTDLALANNRENYMPSANVRCMVREMEMLPMWFATPGDAVLTTAPVDRGFVAKAKDLFGVEVDFVDESRAGSRQFGSIEPWGWNVALRRHLSRIGISDTLLPDGAWLAEYRSLSGRDKDVQMLDALSGSDGLFRADIINNVEDCRRYAADNPRCVFKAPWSGSGKGLRWCFGVYDDKSDGWCRGVIEEQGFLVAAPIYDKQLDFALEYYSNGQGEVNFVGYSMFETNTRGAYRGNILQTAERQRSILTQYISADALDYTIRSVGKQLAVIYGSSYCGYLGVDMMVCRVGDTFAVHPCVEVNMRMNMGVFSVIFAERYLHEKSSALYTIEYYAKEGEALHRMRQLEAEHPLQIESGKVVSGAVPLIPVASANHYLAYILAKQ